MVNLTSKEIKGYSNSVLATNEKNDCFVRALAGGFDITYNKAHEIAKEKFNRPDKMGTRNHHIIEQMASIEKNGLEVNGVMASVKVLKDLAVKNVYKLKGEIIYRKKTVKSFIKDHQKGTYIVTVSKHAFVVKDGNLIDNDGEEFRPTRKVDGAYMINVPEKTIQLSLFN